MVYLLLQGWRSNVIFKLDVHVGLNHTVHTYQVSVCISNGCNVIVLTA